MHKTEITTAEALEIAKECFATGDNINDKLIAYMDGSEWEVSAICFGYLTSSSVQFYHRTPTHIINGFEVAKGVSEMPPYDGSLVYIEHSMAHDFVLATSDRVGYVKHAVEVGIVHTTKESAAASCKARLGLDPYAEE